MWLGSAETRKERAEGRTWVAGRSSLLGHRAGVEAGTRLPAGDVARQPGVDVAKSPRAAILRSGAVLLRGCLSVGVPQPLSPGRPPQRPECPRDSVQMPLLLGSLWEAAQPESAPNQQMPSWPRHDLLTLVV